MHKIRMHPPLLLFSKGLSKSKPWSSLFGSLAASFLWRPLGFAHPPHDGVALLAALLKKMRLTNFIIRFWGISRQHISESQCLGAGLPLFTESPRRLILGNRASAKYHSRKLIEGIERAGVVRPQLCHLSIGSF